MTKSSNIATPPTKTTKQSNHRSLHENPKSLPEFCFVLLVCVGAFWYFVSWLFVYVLLWSFVLLVRLLVSLFQSSKLSREKWANIDILKRQESIGMCIVIKV